MSVKRKIQIGDYIRKTNFQVFGKGENKKPFLKVESIGPISFNKIYQVFDRKFIIVITEEEASILQRNWDECGVLSENKRDIISSCIREDNNQPKAKLSVDEFQKNLYEMKIRFPDKNFEAYKCNFCGYIHIGKVEENKNTWLV